MVRNCGLAIVLAVQVILTGCDGTSRPSYQEVKTKTNTLPKDLEDCKIFELYDPVYITVMRCPNSTTTTEFQSGKQYLTSVVVDG